MPGYAETRLRGMQGLLQMKRMQDAEGQQAAEQQMQMLRFQQLQRHQGETERLAQENQRRLQEGQMQNQQLEGRRLQMLERGNQQRFDASQRLAGASEQRSRDRQRGQLKPGYAWDPSDEMKQVMVPGGPAWREQSSKHADDLNRLGAFGEVADASKATIERILDPKNKDWGFETNFGGYNALISQHLPGKTQNVKNDLENLKSNLKAQGASLMRGVGGAPGSITEREWPILEKMIESLSPLMGESEAKEALNRISTRFEGMKQRSLSNYKQEWGDTPFVKPDPLARPPEQGGASPQGVDPRVWKFMTPAEKKLWQTP